MKDYGILLDETTGDLAVNVVRDSEGKITSGLTLGDTAYQNISLVVLADKGDFKEHPILGVGLERYLKSVGRSVELRREIAIQLAAIGYDKADVSISENGKLEINV